MNLRIPADLDTLRARVAAGIHDAEEGRFVDDTDEEQYIRETINHVLARVAAKDADPPPR